MAPAIPPDSSSPPERAIAHCPVVEFTRGPGTLLAPPKLSAFDGEQGGGLDAAARARREQVWMDAVQFIAAGESDAQVAV